MSDDKQAMVAVVVSTERKRNTVQGNPRWYVELDNGTSWMTSSDSQVASGDLTTWPGKTMAFIIRESKITNAWEVTEEPEVN